MNKRYKGTIRKTWILEDHEQSLKQNKQTVRQRNVCSTSTSNDEQQFTGCNAKEYGLRSKIV